MSSDEPLSPSEIPTLNWLWLATDAVGSLAVFQSSGAGALPPRHFREVEDAEYLDEYCDDLLAALTPKGEGRIVAENFGYTWRAKFTDAKWAKNWEAFLAGIQRIAAGGLYVYYPVESEKYPARYYQAGYPTVPMLLADCPVRVQGIVSRLILKPNGFAGSRTISVSEIDAAT